MPNLYDEIELTPEEQALVISEAKMKKYWRLQEEKKQNQLIQLKMELTRPWTVAELRAQALQRAHVLVRESGREEFVLDEFSGPVFELLCLYFANDPAFEKEGKGYSLSKGILLIGNVGVGKTEMLRAFEYNKRMCYRMVTCGEISLKVDQNGSDYWKLYTGYIPGHGGSQDYFFQPNVGWFFDELGTEEIVNSYGTKVDPVFNILQNRYQKRNQIPFSTLHITSNLNGDMIQQRYGAHIRSRIREMFNVIKIEGEDRRK